MMARSLNRRSVAATFLVGGTLALVASSPALAEAPRAVYDDRFTAQTPGTSTGRHFEVDIFDPADREAKPPAVRRVLLELAEGSRFNTGDLPQCDASDSELVSQGAEACPAESQVGAGPIQIDTGFPGPGRMLISDTTFFNNQDELIILSNVDGVRVPLRGKIRENTLEIEIPPLPGTPPDGGADSGENIMFTRKSTTLPDGTVANYLTTPPVCPDSGIWINRLTYTFADGVKQSFTSLSPCVADPEAARSALTLTRRCTRDGRLDMSIRGDRGLVRDVNFKVDKRLVRRDVKAPFEQILERRTLATTRAASLRAVVYLRGPGSERIILRRSLPRCGIARRGG